MAIGATEWSSGWWRHARRVDSPNFGPRPEVTEVSLALIHSISLPPGIYGGDEIERLFTNSLDWDAHPYFQKIRGLTVSSHFVIRRSGEVMQFVSADERAWHAGQSEWKGRANCNDYSVGIELEGLEGETFDAPQYDALKTLLVALRRQYPISDIVGHEHVAPGRKIDPGPGFDWQALRTAPSLADVSFPA
ncbi:1,6-anhydro-N-acetylmuramyl-L-alanine amidase AmpD [Piscinibacter terrae]|uniref:1,6-anhydro-N-acetylmuramyl-L-alanine amidase AmpD n=1 Tax=Piscinibacter terrae TaxID=2496871 RepID=A0A3N7HMD3_9BURK|nr:1,6-anhydro-N-acetylmuramyl-L-alanine amidase AmpD [Albitalea terrae]RQP23244.1 1,6-anhydro-N-acetylmuramyl-L-alanine amidase AmpD [Albitalea terrae]